MNHSHGRTITRGYIKLDFSPAWELNAKVIDFIFFSTAKSKQGLAHDVEERKDTMFRIAPKYMIYARAYYRGEVLAEVSDIGFSNIDEIISRLAAKLPDSIPERCAVQFRIKNVDTEREAVYERTKGKAFNFCPALQLQGRTFSFVVSQKVKKELQTRSLFVVVVVVYYTT